MLTEMIDRMETAMKTTRDKDKLRLSVSYER